MRSAIFQMWKQAHMEKLEPIFIRLWLVRSSLRRRAHSIYIVLKQSPWSLFHCDMNGKKNLLYEGTEVFGCCFFNTARLMYFDNYKN